MHKFGEVILSEVQYADTFEIKKRPALVLFEDKDGNKIREEKGRAKGLVFVRDMAPDTDYELPQAA